MRLDYWLYMNEAGGYDDIVDTREARLNAIGRELREMGYARPGAVVPNAVFDALLKKHNIKNITQKEIDKIERKWL